MKLSFKILSLISLVSCLTSCGGEPSTTFTTTTTEPYTSITTSEPAPEYDEEPDSTEGIDITDLTGLYTAFNGLTSYRSEIKSFFNDAGLYNYYRHYESNYIQESVSLFDQEKVYHYTEIPEYFDSLNQGYINIGNDYYSFFKRGSTIEERLNTDILDGDMTLVQDDKHYQDDVFSLFTLGVDALSSMPFERVSKNKYALTDRLYLYLFLEICCPHLINDGYYMTFNKVTIETTMKDMDYRIRLYASSTQAGKLLESSLDETNKPNWYLLFSEARIKKQ